LGTIVLWDIDNTLLYTGGAGSLGMTRAFRDLYGVDDAFRRVEFSGRTDTAIFRDAARAHGITEPNLDREMRRFLDAYIPRLRVALAEVEGRLMPGVESVLEEIHRHKDIDQGLGTGNFRAGGQLKLRHYRIDAYFEGFRGGFGEDSESRDTVIAAAVRRMRNGATPRRVVVIGDTPHDITAARANGAFALGVATGRNTIEELIASGADVALDDLTDTSRVLDILTG
jgi:phosphoglycolate phosphatase-like HAD superfamily hydrolase